MEWLSLPIQVRKRSRTWQQLRPPQLTLSDVLSARDDLPFDSAVAEIIDECVTAPRQRRQIHRDCLSRLYHAFAIQFEAFEFDHRIARVGDLQFNRRIRR